MFLDEIATMNLDVQKRFLRVLDTFSFQRVGGHETIQVNVFVIAATNESLYEKVRAHEFREDLYYRLHSISINTVPLRQLLAEDEDNLLQLISYILHASPEKTQINGIARRAYVELLNYDFPGNVRELQQMVKRAYFHLDAGGVLYPKPEKGMLHEIPHRREFSVVVDALLRRYNKAGLAPKAGSEISELLRDLNHSRRSREEKIKTFLYRIGPIDVPTAKVLTGSGETWARKILKSDLNLKHDPNTHLYGLRAQK